QSCSSCGYVDKENRKRREEFECRVCGKKLHADVNGSSSERYKGLWSKARGLFGDSPKPERGQLSLLKIFVHAEGYSIYK
ncbi:MAG TPA: hypothetical protein EYH58_01685, partial [Aquifex aeolicus]|nr:hypothetical protein [Aquifex aeolicus]